MMRVIATGVVVLFSAQAAADYLAVTYSNGQLWRLDEASGGSEQIGLLGGGWRVNSMARSGAGRYFVAADRGGSAGEWIFEVDPHTGGFTPLFSTGLRDIRSMSFGPDGTLYAIEALGNASELWSIDLASQTVSGRVSLFGVDTFVLGRQSLAIDASGAAYMAGPSTPLQSLDLLTGAVTDIGTRTDSYGAQGLTFNGDGELVAIGYLVGVPGPDMLLRTFDTDTGSTLGQTQFEFHDWRGIEWVVPAPGVLSCVGAVAISLTVRRRRPRTVA